MIHAITIQSVDEGLACNKFVVDVNPKPAALQNTNQFRQSLSFINVGVILNKDTLDVCQCFFCIEEHFHLGPLNVEFEKVRRCFQIGRQSGDRDTMDCLFFTWFSVNMPTVCTVRLKGQFPALRPKPFLNQGNLATAMSLDVI